MNEGIKYAHQETQLRLMPLLLAALLLFSNIAAAAYGANDHRSTPSINEEPSEFYAADAPVFWLIQHSESTTAKVHWPIDQSSSTPWGLLTYSRLFLARTFWDSCASFLQNSHEVIPSFHLRKIIFPFHFFW